MSRKVVKSKYIVETDEVESIGEVSTLNFPDWEKNDNLKLIGKRIPRVDGYDKTSGSAVYTYDVILPRMAYAKILSSPHPHANIKKINTKKAEQLEGVYAVLSSDNCPKIRWFYNITFLFDPHVRCEGDEVAAVVAATEQIAEEALKLIEVEYETLPFVTSAVNAMKSDSVQLHVAGNIVTGKPVVYTRGNAEEGFKQADLILEDTFSTQSVAHNPTEVHCSVVNWDGDKLTVWDSTQAIFWVRSAIARSLDMPESNVDVKTKYMGGGFGSKLEAGKYSVIGALLAKRIGRPVKIALDRKQQNLIAGHRPDSLQKFKAGMKKDGTLTAMTLNSTAAVGAYPDGGNCSGPFRGIYKCANLNATEYSVMMNMGRSRAYRAPGHVQGTFALESFVDELAEKAGLDPIEFRMKNYSDVDPMTGKPYTTKLLKEAYKKGAEAIGWNRRKPAGSGEGYIKRGIGMATEIWPGAGVTPAYVTMKMNNDGSVNVLGGSQDLGCGTYTFITQIIAEVLEIPMNRIDVTLGDTSVVPYGPGSGGSMTAPSISPAAREAAELMKSKLIENAAAILEIPREQCVYKEGVISSKTDPKKSIPSNEILRRVRDNFVTTGAKNANPSTHIISTFGAQFAEVEVNIETGKVKVIKIVAAHDIGRVLNRTTLENQFHGGIIQGMGYALMEEQILDVPTGKILNTNLHSYKVPTIKDTPEIEIIIVSEGDPMLGNTGVKGIGEPAIIPAPAAIANAVYNAIGVRIKNLPITPDKILNALYRKG